MFYRLIEKKRDEWYASNGCTVREVIDYIEKKGMMRDAQVEAIKTYLFLKIACKNQPLWKLFTEGRFNTLDLDHISLTRSSRDIIYGSSAAAALLEYSLLHTRDGKPLSPKMTGFMQSHAGEIDFQQAFRDIFYGVDYTDYLFSLPMGAGKTYLMAAFIYIDLYFADIEPDNPAFAHNFLILAPSGLKSSIVPSLRHIADFDPSWIMPQETALRLKRMLKFEVLDQQKPARRSNIIRNPNAQKINFHLSTPDLMGLVAVTNAEKVILDGMDNDTDATLQTSEELRNAEVGNEFRKLIGKIPHLGVFVDEVHHAADGEIKLRQVVNKWSEGHNFCGMLGFSGTPYLEKAESVTLAGQFTVRNTDLSNVVYHYPLIDGIGNFLKDPSVSWSDADTQTIVRESTGEFLRKFGDTVYEDGTCAKLAIYCGSIEALEEEILPVVSEVAAGYGLNPAESILKFHRGNKQYPQPEGSETAFSSLDSDISRIRIVLLVQIGKEGWDCRSLTGVVLPQKGACPQNMVLQTSCRCLRQCTRGSREPALIWMNRPNADTLNRQLKLQQDITLKEFNNTRKNRETTLLRYDRSRYRPVPPVDFYQLKVSYETLTVDDGNDIGSRLSREDILAEASLTLIHEQDMEGRQTGIYQAEETTRVYITFRQWIGQTAKESFGALKSADLMAYSDILKSIFDRITVIEDGETYYSTKYDQTEVRSRIRQCFSPLRDFTVREEVIPEEANLLKIGGLTSPVSVTDAERYYPDQTTVSQIHKWDENPIGELTPEAKAAYAYLASQGLQLPPVEDPHPERKQTYHYIPYHFDSPLETEYFSESVLPIIRDRHLEFYYNGDDTLTEFKIRCYHNDGRHWHYIGMYVPDFLLIQRKGDEIHKIIIIETKGAGFGPLFAGRRKFMEEEFVQRNNAQYGYRRFDFLYLESSLTKGQREEATLSAIRDFFDE